MGLDFFVGNFELFGLSITYRAAQTNQKNYVKSPEYKYYKTAGGSIWFGRCWTVEVMQYNT